MHHGTYVSWPMGLITDYNFYHNIIIIEVLQLVSIRPKFVFLMEQKKTNTSKGLFVMEFHNALTF